MDKKFAAQLYTVRDELKKDFPGTLEKLREMGWSGVQIDGLHGNDPVVINNTLEKTGLKVAGMHVGLDRLTEDLDNVVKEADIFGTRYIYCHYLEEEYQNESGYRYVKDKLLSIGEKLKAKGYKIGYHHHEFEFETIIDGKYALEYLLEPEGRNSIYPEIDTYWIKYAGKDPLSFMSNYKGRMPVLHLKDMSADGSKDFVEIGNGIIDFKSILEWGEKSGVEWYAVEQDYCKNSSLESLEISLKNLKELSKEIETK